MNSNYNLTLKASAEYKGNNYELDFDPYNDCTDMEGLKQLLIDEIVNSGDFEDPIEKSEVTVSIDDYDDVPSEYANQKDLWDFAEVFAECEQEMDVVVAALYIGISPDDIDEAYQGEYKDDEDFAQETAESIGAIDRDAKWPYNCIDWEQAARELMYNYSEHNGYYFRAM